MKIGMACDHGAYTYKEEIKQMLIDEGHEVVDCGCHGTNSVDYPDMAKACADLVVNEEVDKGIVMCGTGIGISIAANKVKGIRCALLPDCFSAQMAKEHNNANMIALGGRVLGEELAIKIVKSFLNAEFQGERHQKRLDKISKMEEE